jgi:hypothetical protein
VIEESGRGVTSWRHHGILMRFFPGTANAVEQTTSFPDYIPNLSVPDVKDAVRERWSLAGIQAVYAEKPWDALFEDRSKYLILHSRSVVNSTFIQGALDRIVAAMKKHRKAFWLVGHWFYVPSDRDDKTQALVQERKSLCDSAKREYQHLLNALADEGFPQSILEESGVWTYPAKCCSWVFMHPSQKKDDGTPYTLEEQLARIDKREPARVQWNTCTSDEDRIKHPSKKRQDRLVRPEDRRSVLVSAEHS